MIDALKATIVEKLAGVERTRLYTAVGAIAIAAATGFVMQTFVAGPKAPQNLAEVALDEVTEIEETAAQVTPIPAFSTPDPVPPLLVAANQTTPEITDPAPAVVETSSDAANMETPTEDVLEPAVSEVVETPACDITFNATARPGALVEINLEAPCNAGEEVEFTHAGLRFTEQLDPAGGLMLEMPAMATPARLAVSIGNETHTSESIAIPDFAEFERVALVWQGATGLQLHALENGAYYGEKGHIWGENPELPNRALIGEGGYLALLGSSSTGFAADIYTFPAGKHAADSDTVISVEAQVMENTCGQEVVGEILATQPEGPAKKMPVSFTIPDCDALGEYLVLNIPIQSPKIAQD